MDDQTAVEVAEETMMGDLVSCVIEEMKVLPRSWQELSEGGQDEVIERVQKQVMKATVQAIHILNALDTPTVHAKVESVTFKSGIKAVLQVAHDAERRHELADSEGAQVLVVLLSSAEIAGNENGIPKADLDQPFLTGIEEDVMFDDALQEVKAMDHITISGLQRKLKIGYNRAAGLIELLQHAGWVTEPDSSGLRQLVTKLEVVEE